MKAAVFTVYACGTDITITPFTQDVAVVLEENNISRISTVIECV